MLDKKYRPTDLDHVFGNSLMIRSLQSVLKRDVGEIPRTMLFQGPSGCGKTTLARIIAEKLSIDRRNLKEYNISNTRGIAQARDIIDRVNYSPLRGGCKVIILNEVHMATAEFQNAMLDVLEDPPPRVFFLLCTTDPQKLLPAIRNNQRGMTFEVEELTRKDITALLKHVLEEEGVNDISNEVVAEICKASQGAPRRALVILDSIIDMDNEQDMLDVIKNRSYDEKSVIDLCRAIMAKKGWKTVSGILKDMKGDPETIRYQVLAYFSKALLDPKPNNFVSAVISEFSESFVASKEGGLYNACYAVIVLYNEE